MCTGWTDLGAFAFERSTEEKGGEKFSARLVTVRDSKRLGTAKFTAIFSKHCLLVLGDAPNKVQYSWAGG